jgi:ATP-dependent DNA helicase RecQ
MQRSESEKQEPAQREQQQKRLSAKLQQVWGYSSFRPPQGEIVQTLLGKQDALIVMPTGGGKSICFQLPALLETGLTLVISPLVALMENQTQELQQRRLPAALLHSELPAHQRRQTLWQLENQRLRLLYLSPETLLSRPIWQRLSLPNLTINGLIIDEAHCLVQWGDIFRPAYRRLGAVRSALLQAKPSGTKLPIAAFTATADPQAQQIIQQVLGLQQPQRFLQNPYRANLHLTMQIAWSARDRRQRLRQFIQARPGTSGLVYVRTRRDTEALADWLTQQGYSTAAYHAGLGADQRRLIEAAWLSGETAFVICTSAFGMGINGQNEVHWICHFHPPSTLTEYVQEIGRAGRKGTAAEALLLVSEPTGWLDPEDKQRWQFFQQQEQKQQRLAQQLVKQLPSQGCIDDVAQQHPHGLMALSLLHSAGQLVWTDPFHYVINVINRSAALQPLSQSQAVQRFRQFIRTKGCRWKFILESFGFGKDAELMGQGCGHCDRCHHC